MPSILTFSELRNFNEKIRLDESTRVIKSSESRYRMFSSTRQNPFLSYSSKDEESIPWIVNLLISHGGNPYIDKGDARLPKPPSISTATVLKERINSCPKLVVFVTKNTKDSIWVPWELGIADGSKGNSNIAIFPVGENSYEKDWVEQEYLGLYQRIVWGKMKDYEKELWMVYSHWDNTAYRLEDWLN